MKTNVKQKVFTHEGGKASIISKEQELERSVMSCMLWENSFYEDGIGISERITNLCNDVSNEFISNLAIISREKMNLRHVPLLLCKILAKKRYKGTSETLSRIIQRADELAEFMSIYWKDGKCPLSAQVKKGLAKAFGKFNEYQFAKYNRDVAIKLRDVMFLCHAKPINSEKETLYKKIANDELTTPDTWEVALSSGANKKGTFTRLIQEKKLGGLALLRNLRNMLDCGVELQVIKNAITLMNKDRILPYRFIASAKYAPRLEDVLEVAMLENLKEKEKISGNTVLLIDVSGSMDDPLSQKSDMTRLDSACGLAIMAREVFENVEIVTFSESVVHIPPRHGFALRDSIVNSQAHCGTYLKEAIKTINNNLDYDRLIIFTDEQTHDGITSCKGKGYIVNVSTDEKGVGYGQYTHINGFSESIIDYIVKSELM